MSAELTNLLTAYLAGWKTIFDCAEWLAGVSWDEGELTPDSREMLGSLELLVTDVLEGLRPEAEFAREASDVVAKASGTRYVVVPFNEANQR